MTSSRWLRILSVVLAFFTLGHTLGTAAPHVTRGPGEEALFAAMQGFRFPMMGFNRTYWDFYRGFALTISVLMLLMTVMAWSLATIARQFPRQVLPMAIALQLACVGLLVLSGVFFFTLPIVMSVAAVFCATAAIVQLVSEGRTAVLVPSA